MDRIISCGLQDNFIGKLADFVEENYARKGRDIGRLAFVFGGRRPALFLKRELARRSGKAYFPPRFFSIDEFVEYVVEKEGSPVPVIPELDAAYLLYRLARKLAPGILKGRERFSRFLPWAREILVFIEQLDLEDVRPEALKNVEANAEIGYAVPESINAVLGHVVSLRDAFHRALGEKGICSRGQMYLAAARLAETAELSGFEDVFFCNFFYLHRTEREIVRRLYQRGRAVLFFQGSGKDWPVLAELSRYLDHPIEPETTASAAGGFSLYRGFDTQSQLCLVREILKKIDRPERTVIVLPEPENVIPLLAEIAAAAKDFNVSLGYPLRRSALHSLFEFLFEAQRTRKEKRYYTRDYLRVLTHPLVKNLKFLPGPAVTRVLIHKIEETLLGMIESPLGGSLFAGLEEVEKSKPLYRAALATLDSMELVVGESELKAAVRELHRLFFHSWEEIKNLDGFAAALGEVLARLQEEGFLESHPLNARIMDRLFSLQERFHAAACAREEFAGEEIFRIAKNALENEVVSFSGSPLKGLQILGLLETRSLNFENVIVIDVNESVLPRMRIYEPLIPREVMLGLGLNRLEREEEIQRYYFRRLIAAARSVHLIYEQSREKEKSRLIEELIWERQRQSGSPAAIPSARASFSVRVLPEKSEVGKTEPVLKFLRDFSYSATSVNTYLRCPLRFYYHYVLGLEEKEELPEEPEAAQLGTFVHRLLEETFRPFVNRRPRLDGNFRKRFFTKLDESFAEDFEKRMKSDAFLLKETLKFRLDYFLRLEEERPVEKIVALEKDFDRRLRLSGRDWRFTARIDRIDRIADGTLLIIDYKTGGGDPGPKGPDKLEAAGFSRPAIKNSVRSFQLPLYLHLAREKYRAEAMDAALYYLRTGEMSRLLADPRDFPARDKIMDVCLRALDFLLTEIVDPGVAFSADEEDVRYCRNCPFFYLCR